MSEAASNTGNNISSSRFLPFTFEPNWTPISPISFIHLSSSFIARSASCIGMVPSPKKRVGY